MAFFDELGKVISDKSKEAANRVKDITGVLQLKSKLSAEKDKINKAYITLGKAYYDRHEGELEGKFADEFHTIQAGLVKIASLEDEIAELEGTRVCAECGAKVEKNAAFCSRCGAPMDSTTSADVHEPEEPEHAWLRKRSDSLFYPTRRLSLKRRMKLQQIRRLTTQKQKARLVQTRIPRMLRTLFRRTPPILRHRMKITAGSRHNLWIHWYNGLQLIYPESYRRRQLSSLSR